MKFPLLGPALSIALSLPLSMVLAGCSSQGGDTQGSGGAGSAGLTYYRDVKPLIDVKCAGCHTEGGIAPFPLTTYEEVSAQRAAVQSAVTAGTMPPWPPNDSCADYANDRSLSKDQIDTLTAWVAAGAPAGDPSSQPAPVADTRAQLSRVDLTLKMPEPYTPALSPDDYRCFLVDWPNADTTYVTGLGVEPGSPSIVHHVIAFLARPGDVSSFQALDDADPGPGWTCFGGPGASNGGFGWIGAWAPGAQGSDFPAGTGIEIPPGSKVVIQVHYNTLTTAPVPDQTSVLLKTDATVEKKAAIIPFTNPSWITKKTMDIPAHAVDATHSFSVDPSPYLGLFTNGALQANQPFTIHSAGLHMHTRGTRALSRITRAGGGDECMIQIDDWNFHWQGSYDLAQPRTFNPGDQLYLECHWDNQDAMDLNWGEGTTDEMCLGIFYATQ